MRFLFAGLFVVLFLALAPAAADGSCAQSNTKTLDRSADVRVYQARRGTVVACSRTTGRRVRLNSHPGTERVLRVVALDRRVVFLLEHEASRGGSTEQLVVLNVRRNRTLFDETIARVDGSGHGDDVERLLDLEANEQAIAYTVERHLYDYTTHQARIERELFLVRPVDRYAVKSIDHAAGIEAGSLTLSPRWLYWTRDAVPQRAPITH